MSPDPVEPSPPRGSSSGHTPVTRGEPAAPPPPRAGSSADRLADALRDTAPPANADPARTGVGSTAAGAAAAATLTALEMQFGDESELDAEKSGDVIGRYTLVAPLGRGGFGTVWEAEQSVPVRRRVALKILRLGMDTRAVVARFEQERQALAIMDHPHVARVLDAGVAATGRPYFVMDLVRGAPLDVYCARAGLDVRARLELFAQVCFAVQHAHGKGVIHRDLKPSNILVGEADGRPHATVIDFGIAKAISPAAAGGDVHTAARQVVGTALYMSPEQAAGSVDLDTRTDVYSLGVVLYELLTGTTPIPRPTHGAVPPHEVSRLLGELDTPTPSSRILASAAAASSTARSFAPAPGAAAASSDPAPHAARAALALPPAEARRLAARVRGELDWIVLKALEKDRARRYQTASDFAADVERHLRGEPVAAAPPSAAYRFRKLVRRHKAAFFAAGALVFALCTGVAGFAWQAREAARERDAARAAEKLADAERLRAERNARTAEAVNRFVDDMLGSADVRALGRDAKVVQVLDRSSSLVGAAFPDDPAVEFGVRRMLARTYLSLGVLDAAEPHVARAYDLGRAVFGERSPEFARAASVRANLLTNRGRVADAVAQYEIALAAAAGSDALDDELGISLRSDYANVLGRVNRHTEAVELLRGALADHRRAGAPPNRQTLVLINSLAVALHRHGRLDEAESLYREALEIGERALGADAGDTLIARMNVGSMQRARGAPEARATLEAAFAGLKRVYGDAHLKTAEAASILGDLHLDEGRVREAVGLLEESLAIRRRAESGPSASGAEGAQRLADALRKLGETARAAGLDQEASDYWTAVEGAEGKRAVDARLRLANALVAAGNHAEAETLFRELQESVPRVLGENHRLAVVVVNGYAVSLMAVGRFVDAEPYLRVALERGRRLKGENDADTVITQCNLATTLRENGRLEEAEREGRDVLARFERVFGPRHANLATARATLAETLAKLGRTAEADALFVEAVATSKGALGARNPSFASSARKLGALRIEDGRAAEAEPVLVDALDVVVKARGPRDRRAAELRLELARCRAAEEEFEEAERLLREAREILAAAAPAARAEARRAARYLAEFYARWNAEEPAPERAAAAVEWRRLHAAEEDAAASRAAPAR